MAACSEASRKWMFLIHHVFLPPKLPQADDTSGRFQEHLARQALKALRTFKASYDESTSDGQLSAIDAAVGAVSNLLRVHNFSDAHKGDATVNSKKLREALNDLSDPSKKGMSVSSQTTHL